MHHQKHHSNFDLQTFILQNANCIRYDLWILTVFHVTVVWKEFLFQMTYIFRWLEKDLMEANRNRSLRPWIVLFGHRPMYCSTEHTFAYQDCTKWSTFTRTGLPFVHLYGMEKLLKQYNVDLVFWAHMHNYERFWPIYDYKVVLLIHAAMNSSLFSTVDYVVKLRYL